MLLAITAVLRPLIDFAKGLQGEDGPAAEDVPSEAAARTIQDKTAQNISEHVPAPGKNQDKKARKAVRKGLRGWAEGQAAEWAAGRAALQDPQLGALLELLDLATLPRLPEVGLECFSEA